MAQNDRKNITFYTKILLISLFFIVILVQFEVPLSHGLFGLISATTCLIFSPVLLITIILSNNYLGKEKVFLILSFICINSILLVGILSIILETKVSLYYFLSSLFLLITTEFLYRKYIKQGLQKEFIKAIYIQRFIAFTLVILVAFLDYK